MVNKMHKSKLDEVVKQTLSTYTASNSVADWAKMERLLDAAPKSNSFRYKHKLLSTVESVKTSNSTKWLFSPYFFIALVLVCGAYFLYNILSSSKSIESTTPSAQHNIISVDTLQTITAPVPVDTLSVIKTDPPKDSLVNPLLTEDKALIKAQEIEAVKNEALIAKEAALLAKTEKIKAEKIKAENLKKLSEQELIDKKNATNLSDKKDSAKTATEELNEKNVINPVQEENNEQLIIPLGGNNILLYNNSDSLKKSQIQQPKDSLKGPN